jgi:outer membrane protein, heavy metal efflux system
MRTTALAAIMELLILFCPNTAGQSPLDPITLDRAVAEARQHNREFLAEQANLPIADARSLTARLRPNPTMTLSADHLDLLGTGFSEVNGAGPSEYAVSTDFTWERSGKRTHRMTLAANERKIAEWELADKLRRLTFEVQSTFLDVMVAQDGLKVARENLATMTQIAEINASRVAAGDLSEVELMRSEVAALQSENTLHQEEFALRAAQNRLYLLMGRTDSSAYAEVAGEFRRDPEPASPEEAKRMALAQRPDLRAATSEEERAASDILLQKATRRIDLGFGTEYRRQQGINATGNSLGFTLSVPLPIFDRNQGELARAFGERNRAVLRTTAIRAAILAEIATALDQQSTARRQLNRIESVLLAKAREVRTVTQYAYQRGEASLLELLDAEKAYMETMQSYTVARAEYGRSSYLIDAVTAKERK